MDAPERALLLPLIEASLALMRLSCERLLVLGSLFVAYVLFRVPPAPARALVRLNGFLSSSFETVILCRLVGVWGGDGAHAAYHWGCRQIGPSSTPRQVV